MASNIYLALGSNKGDRLKYLTGAVHLLIGNGKCKIISASSVYLTSPFGSVIQDDYFNAVIEVETELSHLELLKFCKSIEKVLGRKNEERWGPREIDIDILFYNQLIYKGDDLIIPHSGFDKRDFVLVPLKEIAPDFVHQSYNKKISEFDLTAVEKHIIRKLNVSLI